MTRAVASGVAEGVLVPRATKVAALAVAAPASACALCSASGSSFAAQAVSKAPASSTGISARLEKIIAPRHTAGALGIFVHKSGLWLSQTP